MTLNVYDRSSKDLSQLILDCPVQTRRLHVYYTRHISSKGRSFYCYPRSKSFLQSLGLDFIVVRKENVGPGAHRSCGSNRAWACMYSEGWQSCVIQPTITYKTITQLHTRHVGSWKAGQMVNGTHFDNKEETTVVRKCLSHWCWDTNHFCFFYLLLLWIIWHNLLFACELNRKQLKCFEGLSYIEKTSCSSNKVPIVVFHWND